MTLPTSWVLGLGAFLGLLGALILFIPVTIWIGWPRRRERDLELDLCDAWEEIARLRKLRRRKSR